MNPLAEEWIQKADGDFATASRELAVAEGTNYDAVCFHYQQCIEKCMKALLIDRGVGFSKTHDLSVLLDLCLPFEPTWEALRADLILLSRAAVDFRYPGDFADEDEAEAARAVTEKVRPLLRQALGLS